MLVLSRRKDESIIIGANVKVMVTEVRGDRVFLGINAPSDVPVCREEIALRFTRERASKGEEGKNDKQ